MSLLKKCSVLQACSLVKKLALKGQIDAKRLPKSSVVLEVNCNVTKCGNDFFRVNSKHQRTFWLVVSSMGSAEAMQVAKNDGTLLPSAGVACPLESRKSNRFLPLPIAKKVHGWSVNGSIFCYLPLPIYSGLLMQESVVSAFLFFGRLRQRMAHTHFIQCGQEHLKFSKTLGHF